MKKLSALLLALSLMCCSCGQDNPADDVAETTTEAVTETTTEEATQETIDFVGKWQGVKIIKDGEESDVFRNMPVWAIYQIELCEDGSVKLGETTAGIAGHENSWRWNRMSNSTEIEFFDSENTDDINTLTFDGNYLVYEESDDILYLENVDEFTPYHMAEDSDFVGKWQGVKIIQDGEEHNELYNTPVYAVYQIELCEDGSVNFGEATAEIFGKESSWRWKRMKIGAIIELFDSEDDTNKREFVFDGKSLTYEADYGYDMLYLGKVDEFTPYNIEKANAEDVDADPTAFIGKWKVNELSAKSEKHLDSSLIDVCKVEIRDDNTAAISGEEITGSEDSVKCKWTMLSENELVFVDVNGKNILFTMEDDYIVCQVNGITVSLCRTDKFRTEQTREETTENITHEYTEITDPAILYGKWQGEYMIDENGDKIISDSIPMIYQFDFHEDGTLAFGEILSEAYDAGDYTWEITDSYTIAMHYIYSPEDTDETGTIHFNGEYLIYSEDECNDVYLEKVDEFMKVDSDKFFNN